MTAFARVSLGILAASVLMAQTSWHHRYAEVNGVKLHYVEQGKGELILLLHGFPEFWYEWKNLLPEFARDHHAVAPDMRGYNLSDHPEPVEAYRVPLMVEDVRALAVKLKAHRFILVGHDWGGVIAWAFAAAHPEMLDKLIIVNAPHPAVFARELAENPAQQKASAYFNFFASPQAEKFLEQNDFATLQGLIKPWATPADVKEYLADWGRGLTGGLNYYRAAHAHSPVDGAQSVQGMELPQMPPIEVPTLVIWAEKDTALLTGNLNGLDRQVKHLTIRRIPDGTHWVIHEKTAEVIAYMRDFLGGS
ncbi:MAG TPA: alpha/beta hydrolase [Bryobacteraceae bacterium]|nr:alpha/beta hydrolase [Bryobacteraceae bacterium]